MTVDAQNQRDSSNKHLVCITIDEECMQKLLGTSAEALEQETQYVRDDTVRYLLKHGRWWMSMMTFRDGCRTGHTYYGIYRR